jgi:hypothetical protein
MQRAKSASQNLVAIDDVRTMGGKDLVLKRLVNHYKALANVKPKIVIEPPLQKINSGKTLLKTKIFHNQEYYNVRQTYKGVSKVKPVIDANKPFTFEMGKGKTNQNAKEKFEDFEHIRRLNAMSKRILSIGKV